MLRLDAALSSLDAFYSHATLSLEHVLPQSPAANSQWLIDFPDRVEREQWVHRLGNLVVLTRRKNAQAQNFDFADKKVKYFSHTSGGVAGLAITTQVLGEAVWTPAVLAARQVQAMDILTKLWRLT